MRESGKIHDLLNQLSGKYSVALIRIMPEVGELEEKGRLLEDIFRSLRSTIPDIQECRIMWDELIVIHSSSNHNVFKDKVVEALVNMKHPKLETYCLFDTIQGGYDNYLKCIDKMQSQLHKIGYWTEHLYPHFYINGIKENLNQ